MATINQDPPDVFSVGMEEQYALYLPLAQEGIAAAMNRLEAVMGQHERLGEQLARMKFQMQETCKHPGMDDAGRQCPDCHLRWI